MEYYPTAIVINSFGEAMLQSTYSCSTDYEGAMKCFDTWKKIYGERKVVAGKIADTNGNIVYSEWFVSK